ncbi:hypothetical protein [Taibaiella chishuiensis]|uniref:Uncharacterized protein n=1 Tax=Taibaiella chishuiensis TaxID=1434707 RepID=A0A2P8DDC1_9BACT|nr:hypothetical protein [Taibaiella chishuiensis]PSK95224.1 hypothetical protein B0I18_1011390 [Taibaiella chishuiensis]
MKRLLTGVLVLLFSSGMVHANKITVYNLTDCIFMVKLRSDVPFPYYILQSVPGTVTAQSTTANNFISGSAIYNYGTPNAISIEAGFTPLFPSYANSSLLINDMLCVANGYYTIFWQQQSLTADIQLVIF